MDRTEAQRRAKTRIEAWVREHNADPMRGRTLEDAVAEAILDAYSDGHDIGRREMLTQVTAGLAAVRACIEEHLLPLLSTRN